MSQPSSTKKQKYSNSDSISTSTSVKINHHSISLRSSIKTKPINYKPSQKISLNFSKKSYHCIGCKTTFANSFNSSSDFIKNHMQVKPFCSNYIIHCNYCKKMFMNEQCFMHHISKSNPSCKNYHLNQMELKRKSQSYKLSEVKIPDITINMINKMNYFQHSSSYITNNIKTKPSREEILKKESYTKHIDQIHTNSNTDSETFETDTTNVLTSSTLYCIDCSESQSSQDDTPSVYSCQYNDYTEFNNCNDKSDEMNCAGRCHRPC